MPPWMSRLLPFVLTLAAAGPALAQSADPHAGHGRPDMAPTAPATPTPAQTPAADPHAGHDMSGMNMPGMAPGSMAPSAPGPVPAGPTDTPTSADDAGRPPQATVPPAALSGPVHAADLYFAPVAMAAARTALRVETGDVRTGAVLIDRLETGFGDDAQTYLWDAQGWAGGDIHRFWWKSEGQGALDGPLEEAGLEALYSRAVRPFWDLQAGVRHTFRPDLKDSTDLVLGIQGLAPYWFDVDAAAYLSTTGDLTARIEVEYDQRITRRLILQPRAEVILSAGDAPELEMGSGVSDFEAGLRLRYEVRKEFAPYIGVEWHRSFGETADLIEARGGAAEDTRFVAGIKAWF